MAISLKHAKQSAKADGLDTTLIQPSDWNDEHELEMAGDGRLLGRETAATGPAEEITVGDGIVMAAGALDADFASDAEAIAGVSAVKVISPAALKAMFDDLIETGTYTPVFTNISLLSTFNTYGSTWRYQKIANTVNVWGAVALGHTYTDGASTLRKCRVTLPIASSFTTQYMVSGVGATSDLSPSGAAHNTVAIYADAATNEAVLELYTDHTTRVYRIRFSYDLN